MNTYQPSDEILKACGFRRSPAIGEWCHIPKTHMHYMEATHTLEVYNALPHPVYELKSQDDEAFREEVGAILEKEPPSSPN